MICTPKLRDMTTRILGKIDISQPRVIRT